MRCSRILIAISFLFSASLIAGSKPKSVEDSPDLKLLFETLNQIFHDCADPGHFSYEEDFEIIVVKKNSHYPVSTDSDAIIKNLRKTVDSTLECQSLSAEQREKITNPKALDDLKGILGKDEYQLYEKEQVLPLGYNGYNIFHEYYVGDHYRIHLESGNAD